MEQKPRPGLARRLAANTLHSASGRFASLLVWVILTPPILRAIGTEGFAVWSLFFAVTGYFGALDFGLAWGTVKHVAEARERGTEGMGGAFATLAALGYLLLAAVWFLLALLFRGVVLDWLRIPEPMRDVTGFVMLAGAGVFACTGLANLTMAALQGCGRFDLANLVSQVVAVEMLLGVSLVLRAGWGLEGLVVNVGVGWILGLGAGLWLLRRAEPGFRWGGLRESAAHLEEAMSFGGPMQATNMFMLLHIHLDKFLLTRLVNLVTITPYELGLRVVTAAIGLPQLLVVAVLPAVAELHAAEDHGRLRELHARARRYVMAVGVATLAGLLGSATRLYAVWLGPGHQDAVLVLRVLGLAMAAAMTTSVASSVVRGIGRTDLEAWYAAITFVIHLGLSLVLVPTHGLAGALIATLVANVIGAAIYLWLLATVLGWARTPVLLEPLGIPLVALVAGGAVSLVLDRLFPMMPGPAGWVVLGLVVSAGGAVAMAVTLATRFVRWEEARSILFASRRG